MMSPAPSLTPMIGPVEAPRLHVMTWNIRRRVARQRRRTPDFWWRRRLLLRAVLVAERPTVLGVQESLPDQTAWVLDSLGEGYRSVGRGRDADGGDEASPILWDDRRLALVDWQQLMLSPTPELPGTLGYGNLLPRTAVVARFADRETGARLRVVNMHLDHLSRRSRLRSAQQLRALVAAGDEAIVLLGDANTDVGTDPFRMLTGDGLLRDAWEAAHLRLTPLWGTYSNYRAPRLGRRRIDWLLVGRGITVDAVGINAARVADGDGVRAAASDHEPVQATITVARPQR